MATIGWLGTGLLGSGFVEAALERGNQVKVWNRTMEKATRLGERGAEICSSPEDAVQGVERVHLCLSDDAAVESVLGRVLPSLPNGVPIIDHSTVSPTGALARAQMLAVRGVGFLACPVFMGPANARQATGRMLCAGASPLVQAMAPALRAMTGELVLLGEDVTRPCAIKLIGNSLIIGVTACVADALTLGNATGVSAAEVQSFVASFSFGSIVAGRAARMALGDHTPSFELSMARKDVRLMLESASGRPLAALPAVADRMDALIDRDLGALDLGVLAVDAVPSAKH